ncbi:MAG: hypothetical protein ACREEE_08365, partial [Dongiaceae bacterium]
MGAHVCVLQSARGLALAGHDCFVVADAIASPHDARNRKPSDGPHAQREIRHDLAPTRSLTLASRPRAPWRAGGSGGGGIIRRCQADSRCRSTIILNRIFFNRDQDPRDATGESGSPSPAGGTPNPFALPGPRATWRRANNRRAATMNQIMAPALARGDAELFRSTAVEAQTGLLVNDVHAGLNAT